MKLDYLVHSADSTTQNIDINENIINHHKQDKVISSIASSPSFDEQQQPPSGKRLLNESVNHTFIIERENSRKKSKASANLFHEVNDSKLPRLQEIIFNSENDRSKPDSTKFLKPAKKSNHNGPEKVKHKPKCRISLLIKAVEAVEGQDLDQILSTKKLKKKKSTKNILPSVSQQQQFPSFQQVYNNYELPDLNQALIPDPLVWSHLVLSDSSSNKEKDLSNPSNFFSNSFYSSNNNNNNNGFSYHSHFPLMNGSNNSTPSSSSPSRQSSSSPSSSSSSFISPLSAFNLSSPISSSSFPFASSYPTLFQNRIDGAIQPK